ncbi:serine/threonine-protein phosphatase [Streptomyces sp. A7024]|uniref:Serine/threonine-protein phosphatase n=1 Tax=Streptomyces coryli TaxID=1128680 RepID=A0A6G4TUQ9_9ACTN|nr:PP2C family protein-serine/threonine phosphatase [Streptomyces coryli]NGN62838.1 serine/threonine-protein phosphatase [Streptomyces coryli]
MEPAIGVVPVVAAATTELWVTALVSVLAVLATVWMDVVHHLWGRVDSDVLLVSIAAVCAASIAACGIRRRQERELRQVRAVAEAAQAALLHPVPSRIAGTELRAVYLAAASEARVGGDFFEALHTQYGVRLLIGDVRGKGLPAVGASAALLGCFREAAHREQSLAGVAERLEESLTRHVKLSYDEEFSERFATALMLEIPEGEPYVRMVHCGHTEPLRVRNGRVETVRPQAPGAPVGLGALFGTEHVVQTVDFREGDRLLLYTDGFIECRNRDGHYLPLAQETENLAGETLDHLVQGLRGALLRHAGGRQQDDAALLAVERRR